MFQRGAMGYEGIAGIAEAQGNPLVMSSVRDRIRNMAKTGLVAAAPEGGFVVTDEAADRFGFTKRNDPPKGGSDAGEVAASPDPTQGSGYQLRLTAADPAPHSGGEGG
jgi:hypothetical protein